MHKQWTVFQKVLKRIRPYRMGVVLSMLLASVQVLMSLYIPILVGQAIDCIVAAGNVDFSRMGKYLVGVGACALAAAIAQWAMSAQNNRMTYRVSRDIREEVLIFIH